MGDSACVMHAFSYASPISSEAQQGNPIHALGDSISFGRFMSESLAWERWSTFSHKRYVEEAASYAQPGSVAQKKAFFDAHYKKIASKKAATPLEQANSTNSTTHLDVETSINDKENFSSSQSKTTTMNTHVAVQEGEVRDQDRKSNSSVQNDEHSSIAQQAEPEFHDGKKANFVTENEASVETPMRNDSSIKQDNTKSQEAAAESELRGATKLEEPFLKKSNSFNQEEPSATSKKRPSFSSMISDSTNIKRSSPKSLRALIDSPSTEEPGKLPAPVMQKMESSKVSPTSDQASKECSTPLTTPLQATPSEVSKQPSMSPGWGKTSSKSLTAYQKPEDKFKAKEAEKVKLHTKLKRKAKKELRKLRQSFCFRAQPLPDSYKQNDDDSEKNASASNFNSKSNLQH